MEVGAGGSHTRCTQVAFPVYKVLMRIFQRSRIPRNTPSSHRRPPSSRKVVALSNVSDCFHSVPSLAADTTTVSVVNQLLPVAVATTHQSRGTEDDGSPAVVPSSPKSATPSEVRPSLDLLAQVFPQRTKPRHTFNLARLDTNLLT